VLTGRITPEEFTDDPFLVSSLRSELRLAQARLEAEKELQQLLKESIASKDRQLKELTAMIATTISPSRPNPINVNVTVSPVITSTERWLRLFGQFLRVHKWRLADC
jgi:hypothetical protein